MDSQVSCHLEAITKNAVDVISQKELTAKLKNSLQKKIPLKLKIGFENGDK